MPSHWNNRSPPHSVEIEHRLTVVEVEAQQAKAEARSAKAVTLQHGRRITALEGQQSKRPMWTAHDWLLSAAGITMVLAALFEKIGWSTAVAGFVRLYGLK